MKFVRRRDLTSVARLSIAVDAYLNRGVWGYASDLASRYGVSRQFIYLHLWMLLELFDPEEPVRSGGGAGMAVVRVDKLILGMRLHGRCSEGGISATLKDLGVKNSSIGKISELLRQAASAVPELWPRIGRRIIVIVDETFSRGSPILVAIDALSHYVFKAVWKEDRSGETWKVLLSELQAHGYEIVMVVGDQGTGIRGGATASGLPHFPDLMHLETPFAPFLSRYERCAMTAIKHEYKREMVMEKAKSERNQNKCRTEYEEAVGKGVVAIRKCDNYTYLWNDFIRSFDPFNPDGTPRTRQTVSCQVEAIMQLMETEFDDEALRDKVKAFRKAIPEYWSYFDRLEAIVNDLSKSVPLDALRELCLAWQAGRKAANTKKYAVKKKHMRQMDEHLLLAGCGNIDNMPAVKAEVFARLEENVRSSSPIESINSLIRGYLNNSRGQITQEALDMIVYHLNHRVADRGRFKGTSAWERLTGIPEKSTSIEQILEYVKPADASGADGPTSNPTSAQTGDRVVRFPEADAIRKVA